MMGMGGGGLGGLLRGFLGGGPGGQSGPPKSADDIIRDLRRGPAPERPSLDDSPSPYVGYLVRAWLILQIPLRFGLGLFVLLVAEPEPAARGGLVFGFIVLALLWLGFSLPFAIRGDRPAVAARGYFFRVPIILGGWWITFALGVAAARFAAATISLGARPTPGWMFGIFFLASAGLWISNLVRTRALNLAAKKKEYKGMRELARMRIAAERRAASKEQEDY